MRAPRARVGLSICSWAFIAIVGFAAVMMLNLGVSIFHTFSMLIATTFALKWITATSSAICVLVRSLSVIYVMLLFLNPIGAAKIAVAAITTALIPLCVYFRANRFHMMLLHAASIIEIAIMAQQPNGSFLGLADRLLSRQANSTFYGLPLPHTFGNRTCLDSGAVRNLIWPVGVAPVLEADKHIGSLPMTLAGGPSDEGLLWSSGEVRKKEGKYDQLISLGRLVHRGASVAWNSEHFQLWIPNRTSPIIATVEDYCPWIGADDTAALREFMREDRSHSGGLQEVDPALPQTLPL